MAADLAAQYEQLRSDALRAAGGGGLGLVLFLRQGMLPWMRAASRCTNERQPVSSLPLRTEAILPLEIRSQITFVLAAMIVGRRQEVLCEC